MGTTSSKPKSAVKATSKPKRRATAPAKGSYDYNQRYFPGYWSPNTDETYGYPRSGVVPNYAPVIPPPLAPQYPPYYQNTYPAPVTIPQPQPYTQPNARPVIPVVTQPVIQSAAKREAVQPVIPAPPTRERPKKRKPTRKKMPTAVISFELPKGDYTRRPSESEENSRPPPDLSRSVSHGRSSQEGPSTPQPPASSPTRSIHQRRTSHGSPQTHQSASPGVRPPSAHERRSNPLPKLPVDVFETTPYRHVLESKDLPAWPPLNPGRTFTVQQELQEPPQPPKKGLFGLRKKGPPPPPPISQTKIVYLPQPVSATMNIPPTTATSIEPPPTSAIATTPPTSARAIDTTYTGFQPPRVQTGNDPAPGGFASASEPIYFNQDTEYAPFLNHSPHSVSYERVTYPTATHLIEAMKFLPETDHNQGIADLIRGCVDLADVYRLSHEHREAQIEENGESYMAKMQRVMYLKFNQHGDVANLLLSTGEASLIYDDPSDSFWGIGEANGEPGLNELGQLLEMVRTRLQRERMR